MNPAKRALQLTAAILLIIFGILIFAGSVLMIFMPSLLEPLGLKQSIIDILEIAFIVCGVFGIVSTLVGALFVEKRNYHSKGLAVLALILGIFSSFTVMILVIIFLSSPDELVEERQIRQNPEIMEMPEPKEIEKVEIVKAAQIIEKVERIEKVEDKIETAPKLNPAYSDEQIIEALMKYKKLMDEQILTKEEFDKKKRELLNI